MPPVTPAANPRMKPQGRGRALHPSISESVMVTPPMVVRTAPRASFRGAESLARGELPVNDVRMMQSPLFYAAARAVKCPDYFAYAPSWLAAPIGRSMSAILMSSPGEDSTRRKRASATL